MSWWEAFVLGLVQGLTEFLPISSSAHLRVVGELLPAGTDPGAAFTAITQIGTEAAVLLYFRRDIATILREWFAALPPSWRWLRSGADRTARPVLSSEARLGWWIIIGSVPIVVLGVLFRDAIEGALRNLYLVALTLAVFGLLLGWADRRASTPGKELSELTGRTAIGYGFAQALALVPGVSRSGGTITAGLLMGFSRTAAARYSFLLAIPAVLGSGGYQLVRSLGSFGEAGTPSVGATVLATLIAFVVGYVVIIAFLRIVSTRGYRVFVVYRLAFAALIVVLLLTGVLQPLGGA